MSDIEAKGDMFLNLHFVASDPIKTFPTFSITANCQRNHTRYQFVGSKNVEISSRMILFV